MKFKTTKRNIMNGYTYVIETGYCSVYDLLSLESPATYTCGVYGWNADVYTFGDAAIVTGYRPYGRLKVKHETLERYKKEAQKIKELNRWNYESTRAALRDLIFEFIETVKNENGIK